MTNKLSLRIEIDLGPVEAQVQQAVAEWFLKNGSAARQEAIEHARRVLGARLTELVEARIDREVGTIVVGCLLNNNIEFGMQKRVREKAKKAVADLQITAARVPSTTT